MAFSQPSRLADLEGKHVGHSLCGRVHEMRHIPKLVFGDINREMVSLAEKIGLGEEWVCGDPMSAGLDAIVSPANTVGEMSGGYDLVIRNRLGRQVEQAVMASLADTPLYLGQARAIATQASIPWLIVVPTVVGRLAGTGGNTSVGSLQSKTPSVEVAELGTYSLMHAAFDKSIKRVGTVLLGGGVGGLGAEPALRAMLSGYLRAYDELDEALFGNL